MSAFTTRLLVLGVVRTFGPVNGYQLRRELLSWDAENWAHLNPGSIYSMLGTLEREALVERHDLEFDGKRPVAVYTATAAGDAEFRRLVRDSIAVVHDTADPLPLRAGINFAMALPRAEFLAALSERIEQLAEGRDQLDRKVAVITETRSAPPQVVAELELEISLAKAQYDWALRLAARVQAGAFDFIDDPDHGSSWMPAEDPGWRMRAEREEYLRELAARGWSPGT